MSSVITPKTIESGWMSRWLRDGTGLWKRNPTMLILDLLIIPVLMAIIPDVMGLGLLVEIPFSAFLFVQLRMLDQHSQEGFSGAWRLFLSSIKDILYLTRDVFIAIFFVMMIMTLTALAVHTSAAQHDPVQTALAEATQHMQTWLSNAIFLNASWNGLLINPISGPLVYLTLLTGHQILMHLNTSIQGIFKNKMISITLLIISVFVAPVIGTLMLFMQPFTGIWLSGVVSEILMDFMTIVASTVLYLWSREMFEGTTENTPAQAFVKKQAFQLQTATK